jgi:hypothetical protein
MCQCTPTIRTPWCGRPGCERPPDAERPLLWRLGLIGVKQTNFGRGPDHGEECGNCMQAALATVLGRALDEVPHFLAEGPEGDWWERMNDWLLQWHRVALIGLKAGDWHVPRVVHLMQGQTVRGSSHVVVGFAGEMIWDPHPNNDGLSVVEHIEIFAAQRA